MNPKPFASLNHLTVPCSMMVLIPCVLNVTFEIGSYLRQYQLRRGVDAQKASVSNVPRYYSKLLSCDGPLLECDTELPMRGAIQVADLIAVARANPSCEPDLTL